MDNDQTNGQQPLDLGAGTGANGGTDSGPAFVIQHDIGPDLTGRPKPTGRPTGSKNKKKKAVQLVRLNLKTSGPGAPKEEKKATAPPKASSRDTTASAKAIGEMLAGFLAIVALFLQSDRFVRDKDECTKHVGIPTAHYMEQKAPAIANAIGDYGGLIAVLYGFIALLGESIMEEYLERRDGAPGGSKPSLTVVKGNQDDGNSGQTPQGPPDGYRPVGPNEHGSANSLPLQ